MKGEDPPARLVPANVERKLVAILSADVAGYSRLMGVDEVGTLRTLTAAREVTDSLIQQHRGRIVGTAGDSILAEFASAVDAVQCAVEIQHALTDKNAAVSAEQRMEFRIGINIGDVVVEGEQIYGDGVNVAARIQSLADAGGIFISGTVYDQIENKLALNYEYLGEQAVKNITKPVRTYRVKMDEAAVPTGGAAPEPVLSVSKDDRSQDGQPHRVAPTTSQTRWGASVRLRWIMTGLALVAATIIVVRYFSLPTPSTQHPAPSTQALPLPDKPSIVVLPFVNMSDDPKQDYFSDGITEDLTSDLSKLSGLFVIARNSAFTYKGKAVKVQEVSREMGVRYVLEGSVRKAGEQVRVTAQLINGPSGGHLWSARYDRPLTDIFAVQDEIVQQLVNTLRVEVHEAELERVRRIPTHNLTAYDSLLRGGEYMQRWTKEGNVQARQLFEQAIALDPQFAAAYTGLGWTYWGELVFGWSATPQTLERMEELARQALALNDALPPAHGLLSHVYVMKHQPEAALAAAEQAVTLDPNYAEAHIWRAQSLMAVDRPAEAVRAVEEAMRLNPRSPFWYPSNLGRAYYLAGRYEEAIAAHQQVLLRNPTYQVAYMSLVVIYTEAWLSQLRQDPRTPEQALEAAQRAVALDASSHLAHHGLSVASLLNKQYDQAVAEFEQGLTLSPGSAGIYPDSVAESLNFVGRPTEALRVMEQALRLTPRPPARYFMPLGQAYYLLGRTEEAIEPLQKFLSVYPYWVRAHVLLAAAYSEVGREPEAQAEAAEVLRLSPQYSLEAMRQRWPAKDPVQLERLLAALRQAGLK